MPNRQRRSGGSALVALIEDTTAANGWSWREVARYANDHGASLTPTDLTNWRNTNGMKTLSADKVRSIAVGLRLPVETVVAAVLEDLGLPAPGRDAVTVEQAIRRDPALPDDLKAIVLSIVKRGRRR